MSKQPLFVAIGLSLIALLGYLALRPSSKQGPQSSVRTIASLRTQGIPAQSMPHASWLSEADPVGELRLEGQVIDDSDNPVAGAVVTINSVPRKEILTEEDGSFYFDKLPARRYTLIATSGKGFAGPIGARLGAYSDPIILRLQPSAKTEIQVVSAGTRTPIIGARVTVHGWNDRTGTLSDDKGISKIENIPYGSYRLSVSAPGFASFYNWLFITSATSRTKVELVKGAAVMGQVLTPMGEPAQGARVTYSNLGDFNGSSKGAQVALTDRDGKFRIFALAAGSYQFTGRHASFSPGDSPQVTLDGQTETSDIEIHLGQKTTIAGIVVNSSGAPVAAAVVNLGTPNGELLHKIITDKDGKFKVQALPQRKLYITARSESASSSLLSVDLTSTTEAIGLKLELVALGRIGGIVVDEEGEPIDGAQLEISQRDSKGAQKLHGIQQELTDTGGRFEFQGLSDGEHVIKARVPGPPATGITSQANTTLVTPGEEDVRIILKRSGAIVGKVAFTDGTVPAAFTIAQGSSKARAHPFTSDDGSFEITSLPPGEYTLTFRGASFEAKTISRIQVLPGLSKDIGTILVRPGMSISGQVVTTDGQGVAGAQVVGGHILIGSGTTTDMAGMAPGFGLATQTATTDDNGWFNLVGIGRGDITLIASHESIGRSSPKVFTGAIEPVSEVRLVLKDNGAIEGTVTRNGKPAGGQMINAQSKTAPLAMAVVRTQPDGKYRFDKLSPGRYSIGPVDGFGTFTLHTKAATIEAGKTTRLDIDIKEGTLSLEIIILTEEGTPTPSAAVVLTPALVETMKGNAMLAAIGDNAGSWTIAITGNGRSVHLTGLAPDDYSACALALPDDAAELMPALAYLARYGSFVTAHCKPVTLSRNQNNHTVKITTEAPSSSPDEDSN